MSQPLTPPPQFAPETELRFRLAGVIPPDERAPGTYANAQRLLPTPHWLRQPRTACEPAAGVVARWPELPLIAKAA